MMMMTLSLTKNVLLFVAVISVAIVLRLFQD